MRKQLASVEFANLLQINWNEQKIQNNFKTIVDALTDGDKDRLLLKEEVQSLKDEVEFIKSVLARQGDGKTSQLGNVQGQPGLQAENDPFKLREMIQKLQKQSKEMSNKQCDQDGLLQKIQQIQSELRDDLNNSKTKREEQNIKIGDNISKGQSRQNQERNGQSQGQDQVQKQKQDHSKSQSKTVVSNPKLSQMQFEDDKKQKQKFEDKENQTAFKKEKTLTSIKDIHQNNAEVGATGLGTSTKINIQLAELLERIEQLKSDNLRINARLNSNDQTLEGLRKLPVQASRLKSTVETKPIVPVSADISKPVQQKAGVNQNDALRNQIGEIKEDLSTLQEQINKYYLDANTLRLCYQEMKLWISDIRKSDNKKDILIHDLDQRTSQISQSAKDDKDLIDLELKELRETMLKIAMEQKPLSKQGRQDTPTASQGDRRRSAMLQYDENYKDKINDKLSRLQALLMQAATQSDLERLRIQLKENIQDNNNKIQSVKTSVDFIDKKFEELDLDQQSQNSEIKKLEGDIAGLSGLVNDKFGAIDKKGTITNNKIQDIRKHLQQLKEDLEHYKENVNRLTELTDGMQLVRVSKGDSDQGGVMLQPKSSGDFGKKKYQELRKQMLNKIHDNRQQLLNALKDFERRSNNKNTYEQDIVILFDKIGEIKQFLSKKADAEDTKKSILYLQKKMSVAFSSLNSEDENTEDARAAKKNWFCLSCDKVLQNYNGKVGKHIVWDSLGTSKFNPKVTVGAQEGKKSMKQTLPSLRR